MLPRFSLSSRLAEISLWGGWTRPVHPPFDRQRAGFANLLSGNDHRDGLHLTAFGELFAFSLGERFVN